jgi:hypothetical protein
VERAGGSNASGARGRRVARRAGARAAARGRAAQERGGGSVDAEAAGVRASASTVQEVTQAGEEARGVEANAGAAVRARRRWSAAARRWLACERAAWGCGSRTLARARGSRHWRGARQVASGSGCGRSAGMGAHWLGCRGRPGVQDARERGRCGTRTRTEASSRSKQ